jgi:hypothetical protein
MVTPSSPLLRPLVTYALRAVSADYMYIAVPDTIAFLKSHAVMAGTGPEDSSTDVSDSSTDVSGDEGVAGIIVLVMK